jgi:hypothetical protein
MLLAIKKLLEEERQSLWGKLFQGAGLSAGGVAVYEAAEFFKANPAASLGIVREFGPIFALAVLLTALVNRLIGVLDKFATSSQETADAIKQIADKDDRQTERMELMTQYNAQRAQEAADSMGQLHEAIRLQNSALDRIERRLDLMHEPHRPVADITPQGKGLPT